MKSALVIGGTTALSTATSLFGTPEVAAAGDRVGLVARNNRQHAWDAFEAEARGTTVPPHYHVLLHLDYEGEIPDGEDRAAVEGALRGLEETFEWSSNGLLFTLGYSPAYFDRYDEPLPEGLAEGGTRLIDPETTVAATAAPHEDPDDIVAETFDAVLHMASNDTRKLLAAEAALWGDDNEIVELDATFEGVFTRPTDYPARRSGFAGHEQLEERYEAAGLEDLAEEVPEESGLSMGFNALYGNSVPREELASMVEDQKLTEAAPPGVFAQGSIEHVSKLDVKLEDWYGNNSLEERRHQMLSPHHSEEETGVAGENLGESNDPDEAPTREAGSDGRDIAERTVEDAKEKQRVGHVQKTARARFDIEARETGGTDDDPDSQTYEQPVLRRDFPTTDQDRPGVHFIGLMRFNGYMHYVRQAMNGDEFDTAAFGLTGEDRITHEAVYDDVGDADGDGDSIVGDPDDDGDNNNGIVPYLNTRRRGNFLLPPVTIRALPPARAIRPNDGGTGFEVRSTVDAGGEGHVAVHLTATDEFDPSAIDPGTIRFGAPGAVNRGGGVTPDEVRETPRGLKAVFPAEGTGFTADSDTARLFAKTTVDAGRLPVFATDDVRVTDSSGDDGSSGRGDGGGNGRGEGGGGDGRGEGGGGDGRGEGGGGDGRGEGGDGRGRP